MCKDVLEALAGANAEYAVFGSAAGEVYGWSRPPRDVDVAVRCDSIDQLGQWFPHARRLPPNGLQQGDVELWAAPLILRDHTLSFDAALSARRLPHPALGWVLAPEDQLVITLALSRSEAGKRDLDDAAALMRHWAGRLDRGYLMWRAAQSGVTDRVAEVLS